MVRLLLASLLLSGCSSLIKDPPARDGQPPVATSRDTRVEISLDGAFPRNAKGSWVRNADWDEYHVRIVSRSAAVTVREVVLIDATGAAVNPSADRDQLVDGTRAVEARYQASSSLVRSKDGGWMFSSGAATVAGSVALFTAVAPAAVLAGAGVVILPVVGVVAGAVYGVVGLNRLVDKASVNSELERRSTSLPLAVPRDAPAKLVAFFPITPLPARLEIAYTDGTDAGRVVLDTRVALADLHREPPPLLTTGGEPIFPRSARQAGIAEGRVRARLAIDANGFVDGIEILESEPPGVFDREARATWRFYRYTGDSYGRPRYVEETLFFKDPAR